MIVVLVYAYGLLSAAAIAGAVMGTLFNVIVRAIVDAMVEIFLRERSK